MSAAELSDAPLYGLVAKVYLEAGWDCPVPLPEGQKKPPPAGFTGDKAGATVPTAEQVEAWSTTTTTVNGTMWTPASNIGLRAPVGVIGLDLDLYKPEGRKSYDELVAKHGPLPDTWVSTARADGSGSGIYWFTIPVGVKLHGKPPGRGGIEIIQRHHRYAVAPPSIHPDLGVEYRWFAPGWQPSNEIPIPHQDYPGFPDAWLEEFRADKPKPPGAPPARHHVDDWSPSVTKAFADAVAGLTEGSRHDTATQAAATLARYEVRNHPGATEALDRLGSMFRNAIHDRATDKQADKEWDDILRSARALAASTPSSAPQWEDRARVEDVTDDELDALDPYGDVPHPAATSIATERSPHLDRLRSDTLTTEAVKALRPPDFLVNGLIVRGSLGELYGKAGLAKSLFAVDVAQSVASGRSFHGRLVVAGPVVYVVAEGLAGTGKRIAAWEEHHGHPDMLHPVHWVRRRVNLFDPAEAEAFHQVVDETGAVLFIIDTRARCTVGADENSSKDMGVIVDRLARLCADTGATGLTLHHPGKEAGRGGRGSTAWLGAVDTELEMTGGGNHIEVAVRKQKDFADGEIMTLTRLAVGDSIVLTAGSGVGADDLAAGALETLQVLRTIELGEGASPARWLGVVEIPRRTFYDHRRVLLEHGFIRNIGTKNRPLYQAIRPDGSWPDEEDSNA